MLRGRRIAFDYGEVRTGVAVCDPDGVIASPLTVIRSDSKTLRNDISQIFAEYEPVRIFVGLPKQLSGEEGASAAKSRAFAAFLAEITDAEILFIDERLSTVSALAKLRESGRSSKESKEVIDAVAAVEILEAGLAHERSL